MKTTKQAVLDALTKISAPGEGKNMVESGAVTNVVVFGDEVVVDVVIDNPTLQARKKTEVSVMQVIHAEVDQKLKVKVNIKVEVPQNAPNPNLIKGKPIPGIKNIVAIASGKGGGRQIYRNCQNRGYPGPNGFPSGSLGCRYLRALNAHYV